jgi:endonuclease YncB( thermonuclease family)
MKSKIKSGLSNGRNLTLLTSVMCISLIGTGCADKEVVAQEIDESAVDTVVVVDEAPEVVEVIEVDTSITDEADEKSKVEAAPAKAAGKVSDDAGKAFLVSDIKVIDGDIFTAIRENGKKITVRMARLDAPEIGQDLAGDSAEQLRACLASGNALITVLATNSIDDKARTLAKVESAELNCNQQQIETGMAWMYDKHDEDLASEDYMLYVFANRGALDNKRGLWEKVEAERPWAYRERLGK